MKPWYFLALAGALVVVAAGCATARAQTGSLQSGSAPPAALAANTRAPAGKSLRVSLLTFGPGRVYWERFGHDAILIRDLAAGTAIAYNYGIFDFNQQNFFLNFARGNMIYRMSADPLTADLQFYAAHGRSVTEQRLNLTPAERLSLARFLRWNVLPANTRYPYDYFLSNCATRVRDALNRALGGRLKTQLSARPAQPGHSYRFDAVRALSPDTWLAMIMDVALGPSADHPLNLWQDSFLPGELAAALEHVTTTNAQGQSVPLVASTTVLIAGRVEAMPAQPPNWLPLLLVIGLGTALLLLALNFVPGRATHVAFATIASLTSLGFGLAGLGLVLIWAFTHHWAGWHNENLLIFDPLCLLLIPTWLASAKRQWQVGTFARALAIIVTVGALAAFAVRAIPGAWQDNLHWIALAAPIHVALLLCLWMRARRKGSRE